MKSHLSPNGHGTGCNGVSRRHSFRCTQLPCATWAGRCTAPLVCLLLESPSPQDDPLHRSDIVGLDFWTCGFGNPLQPICSPSQQVRNVEQLRRPSHEWNVKNRERITGSGLRDVFSWLEVTIVSDKTKRKGRSSRRGNRPPLFGWVHSRWESKWGERSLSERASI